MIRWQTFERKGNHRASWPPSATDPASCEGLRLPTILCIFFFFSCGNLRSRCSGCKELSTPLLSQAGRRCPVIFEFDHTACFVILYSLVRCPSCPPDTTPCPVGSTPHDSPVDTGCWAERGAIDGRKPPHYRFASPNWLQKFGACFVMRHNEPPMLRIAVEAAAERISAEGLRYH